jgi:serine/threonine protein kinase
MEFCDGGDLAHVIEKHKQQRRNIDENTIWAVLMQLLDGLEALEDPDRIFGIYGSGFN